MATFRETWTARCAGAEEVRERFGVDKAIGYLVGEKFFNALGAARSNPEVAKEIPAFAARIAEIFDRHQLVAWFASVRRFGAFGHIASDDEYRLLVAAGAVEEDAVRGGEEILALERPRELLIDDDG